MKRSAVLVTGANGEIGRSLIQTLARDGGSDIITLDLTPLPESMRPLVAATYAGNIMDRFLLDQVAAHHEVDQIFHLAALLSTRGERDPELAHQVNVEGTLNLLRVAQNQSSRLGTSVRFLFPSSIAVYGLPSVEEKKRANRVRENEWNVPITMYGCNKLYCEHLGRYYTNYARQLGALSGATRLDFRSIRFPGIISAETVPTGGTSDYGPEMIHAAAQGVPYECFVEPDATIPFMVMPDAVRSLVKLARADKEKLSSCVYNISAFSVSAEAIRQRVQRTFPKAVIGYSLDAVRAKIVASWPQDLDDSAARADWGWAPSFDEERAFEQYLVPSVRHRYGAT